MLKRKLAADAKKRTKKPKHETTSQPQQPSDEEHEDMEQSHESQSQVEITDKKTQKALHRDLSRYINKQRVLVFASRGIRHRDRHFMQDLRDLLPHHKKDVKLDEKGKLSVINEIAEMKNCNSTIYLESRKKQDLYMWLSKTPNGPSVKFLVQNIHTMAEVKLTGNCLKGSRPLLCFDAIFDTTPVYQLFKTLLQQLFGAPKGHPKVKPFIDHVFSFFIVDNRVWFRNYQVVYDAVEGKTNDPVLVEIGPRFVLNPVRVFSGSFGGSTLWENPHYISPNAMRASLHRRQSTKFINRTAAIAAMKQHHQDSLIPDPEVDTVFHATEQQ
uniref:Brix domain-containing protein n=1 Tax=Lotus japonicus TaxID=34305 RepID=I3SRR0_LOTJA|nr:unknown [Lotus japonicus]